MKILLLSARHNTGGADTVFTQETEILLNYQHEVAHFSARFNPEHISCPVPHYFGYDDILKNFKQRSGLRFKLARGLVQVEDRAFWRKRLRHRFYEAIQDFKPDIIHCHHFKDFILRPSLFKVSQQLGIPTLYTIHGCYFVCPNKLLLKGGDLEVCDGICSRETPLGQSSIKYHCFQNPIVRYYWLQEFNQVRQLPDVVDLFSVPSQALMDLVVKANFVKANQVQLLYNPANPALLDCKVDLNSVPKQSYFLAVGRLERIKGFMELIKVFAGFPEIPLKIVGDGFERQVLERYIADHGLTHIEILPWQSGEALWQIYNNSYGVIIPSLVFESAGLVVQESFFHGKPVIGVNNGGVPEFIHSEETGLLFEPHDWDMLAQQVKRLWDNPQEALAFGKKGYELVHRYFNQEYSYQALMAIYQRTIENSKLLMTLN